MLLALCTAAAMEPTYQLSGVASAILGLFQTLASALGAYLAALMFDGSHRTICYAMGFAGLTIFVIWLLGKKHL